MVDFGDGNWPHVRVSMPAVRKAKMNGLTDLDAQRIDDLVAKNPVIQSGAAVPEHPFDWDQHSPASTQMGWLMEERKKEEELRLADARAFIAEVEKKRSDQKRRNQRREIKRLNQAILLRNNQVRKLNEFCISLQEDLDLKRNQIDNLRAQVDKLTNEEVV